MGQLRMSERADPRPSERGDELGALLGCGLAVLERAHARVASEEVGRPACKRADRLRQGPTDVRCVRLADARYARLRTDAGERDTSGSAPSASTRARAVPSGARRGGL